MTGQRDRDAHQVRRTAPLGYLTRLIDFIDRRVSARTDDPLVARGYTITDVDGSHRWSRTREYRLPVWDLRHECGACNGSGLSGHQACRECAGTGVITEVALEAGETR